MVRNILRIAAWFGLVTGVVEGVAFVVFQALGWLAWIRVNVPVAPEIIWIAPLVDLFLFGVLGIALALVARFLPRVHMTRYAFLLCAFCAFYDWLALSGHLYRYAVTALALGFAVVVTRWVLEHEASCLRAIRASLPALAVVPVLAAVAVQSGQWLQERLTTAQLPVAVAGSPNVLVIVVDTLRADHLSTYGYMRPTSPNLDRLAQQGVLFENAVSTSSWTLPAHASLVTGRYTYEHHAEMRPLDDRYPTIGEALRARGYRTGAFSGNVMLFNRAQGFGRGFLHFEDYFHTFGDSIMRTLYGREARNYLVPHLGVEDIIGRRRAAAINDSVVRWIERDPSRPFFAFLNYFDTHDPYVPPEPYRRKFATSKNLGGLLRTPEAGDILRYPDMTPEQLQGEIDAYDGAIAYTDDHIGQLLADLRQRGLLDNAFVVVTADHGESFGEHGLFLHRNALYWESIHVPLIMVRPGVVPAGLRVARPVSNATLAATIMALVGAGDQTMFPQPSLTHFWSVDGTSDWPSPIAELAQAPWGPQRRPAYHGAMKSIVSSDWHYILHEKFGAELYGWEEDPGELHDLAHQAEMQDVVSQLGAQLSSLTSHEQPLTPQLGLVPVPRHAAAAPAGS